MSLKKLGRYELVRVLGKGAMGIVYEGKDPNLDRRVAIKTVKVENLSEEAAAEYEHRFRTEARSAARLQHPNIVSVYDSDRDGDIAFLVMEFVQGDDLKHHLDRGVRYSLEQSLKIIRDLLSALDYAHKQGIVHRDIKPANLMIEPSGRVKLTDFGVARIQDSSEATRTQGSMVGTLKYMSPEQVQGQKIDSRADLFSVGVVLYQMLTDKRPFDGENDFSIIHQIIGHNPPPPSQFNAKLPPAIDAVVARGLAKNRDERFATARDFAVALQSAIRRAEDQTVVPPADPFKKSDKSLSKAGVTAPGGASVPGGMTTPGGLTTPGSATTPSAGSTVTQEVELVYWKDIKDSSDPDEFQSYLDKFPTGIYSDLARRRLRKLTGVGEQTQVGGAGGDDPDAEATRLRSDPIKGAPPGGADWTKTVVQSRAEILGDGTKGVPGAAAAASGAAAVKAAPVAEDTQVQPPPKKKAPVVAIAAVLVVAIAAATAYTLLARKTDPAADAAMAAASAAASAASVAAASDSTAASAASAPASATLVAAASAAAAPASAPASKPASAASAPRPVASRRTQVAAPTPTYVPPPVETPIIQQPVAVPAPQPVAPPQPVQPAVNVLALVDQCASKVFLSKELCLAEQCDKPGARNHPLCVKRREDARLREDAKVRQGPAQPP
ncbi:MAG: serine/threonine protein kinase [Burkholderiales bacterium]|nr:serine/threonine protein kinase [Burkholderiales bacterium]